MKPRHEPPPVDALSDVAWARVERGIWSRLDRERASSQPPVRGPRWMWLGASAAACVAIALVVVVCVHRAPVDDDGPARVIAGDSPSAVSFGDAHITLDAHSAVVMQADRHTVLLENGAAWFAIGPRGDRPAFEVRAGDATVRVVGTRFQVSRQGELIRVVVDHGVVAVDFRGSHVELIAGRSWTSAAPDAIAIANGPPVIAIAPVPPVAPPAPVPIVPSADPSVAVPAPAVIDPRGKHPTSPPPPRSPPDCDADCQRYQSLARLEAKQPTVAINGYLELSQGAGKWASIALYAAGRLAADRHDPRARALLATYLRRFPTGANAADVGLLLSQLKGTSP